MQKGTFKHLHQYKAHNKQEGKMTSTIWWKSQQNVRYKHKLL